MPSTYTTNLGIEKIATGEQSGTWGTTTNTNFDLIDTAVNGIVSVTLASAGTSGSPNDLPITDGTASNGRNKFVEFVDGGDLGATAYVQLTPNDAEKIVNIRNSLSGSRSIIVFQGTYNASNDFEIPNGADVTLKFNGGGTGATVTDVNVDLTVTGVTATSTASFSGATIDDLGTVTTADINGGTIDGTVIGGSSAAAGTFTTANATTVDATNIEVTNIKAKDGTAAGSIADSTGVVTLASSVLTTADINGGTADGVTIGGSSAAAGTFTTFTSTGIDDNATSTAITIDSSENVGIGTTSPGGILHLRSDDNGMIFQSSSSANSRAQIFFQNTGGTTTGKIAVDPDGGNANVMAFSTGTAERMRIDSSGNVGIGTSSPSMLLGTGLHIDSSGYTSIVLQKGGAGQGHNIDFTDASNALQYRIGTNFASGGENLLFAYGSTPTIGMTLNSSGNVGIGTASPAVKTQIVGSGAIFRISDDVSTSGTIELSASSSEAVIHANTYASAVPLVFKNASTERMRIDTSGNVGIGTTSPAYKLSVHADAVGTTYPLKIENGNTTSGNGVALLFTHRAHGGDNQGSIEYVGAGANNTNSMLFKTEASGVNGMAERMRIDGSGNVLVGTASAMTQGGGGPLQLYSSAGSQLILGKSTGAPSISLGSTTTQYGLIEGINGGGFSFYTGNGTVSNRLVIDASGNLGLNTTAPSSYGGGFVVDNLGINIVTASSSSPGTNKLSWWSDNNGISQNAYISTVNDGATTNTGEMVFYTKNASTTLAERMRISASGNLLVGRTSTSYGYGTTGAFILSTGQIQTEVSGACLFLNNTNGTGTATIISLSRGNSGAGGIASAAGGTPSFVSASDAALKDNIQDHGSELNNVMAIQTRVWDWKDKAKGSGEGVVAQELEQTAWADLVSEGYDGYKQVSGLGAVETRLIKAIQEQQAMIETLQAQVAELQGA